MSTRLGLLFPRMNGCGGAVSVTSDTALRRSQKRTVTYRTGFVPYFGAERILFSPSWK